MTTSQASPIFNGLLQHCSAGRGRRFVDYVFSTYISGNFCASSKWSMFSATTFNNAILGAETVLLIKRLAIESSKHEGAEPAAYSVKPYSTSTESTCHGPWSMLIWCIFRRQTLQNLLSIYKSQSSHEIAFRRHSPTLVKSLKEWNLLAFWMRKVTDLSQVILMEIYLFKDKHTQLGPQVVPTTNNCTARLHALHE